MPMRNQWAFVKATPSRKRHSKLRRIAINQVVVKGAMEGAGSAVASWHIPLNYDVPMHRDEQL